MSEVYIAVTVSSGEVYHLALQTEYRAPKRPRGDGWTYDEKRGFWVGSLPDSYIEYFIALNERQWSHRKDERTGERRDAVTVLSWRKLTQEEHELFDIDRRYRNALRDNDGKLEYDIEAARECHRNKCRMDRANHMPQLDINWMRAMAAHNYELADAIEAERQRWRDAPIDPRIDAAQSVDELKLLHTLE